jgi:hypothetical protein
MLDLTDPSSVVLWLHESHSAGLAWLFGYIVYKAVARYGFGRADMSVSDMAYKVWDPACLLHNLLSVAVGAYAVFSLSSNTGVVDLEWMPSAACTSVTDARALVILLQACHCVSDFLVFLPQMVEEPVFIAHHFILLVVSLVLPNCNGCYWSVIAFAIAELGSASIAMDAEYRKYGYPSTGLWRVVIFGGSRLVNLGILFKIWQVTPIKQLWQLSSVASTSNSTQVLQLNFPLCFIASVGGAFFMLCVNGVTWYRMWKAYRRVTSRANTENENDKSK